MTVMLGFDRDYYVEQKLQSLRNNPATAQTWADQTRGDLLAAAEAAGLTPRSHYERFGYDEYQYSTAGEPVGRLTPNPAFDAEAYIAGKAAQLMVDGVAAHGVDFATLTPQQAEREVIRIWDAVGTGNVYDYYDGFGRSEGVTATADAIRVGDTIEGALDWAGDEDWLAVDLQADQTYRIEMTGDFEGALRLADRAGDPVPPGGDEPATDDSTIEFSPDTSGRFHVIADAAPAAATGDYSVSVSLGGGSEPAPSGYVGARADTYPYRAVTYVEATFPSGVTQVGSGAVVGTNDVLTASHVIYSAGEGGLADKITVYPGLDATDVRGGRYEATSATYYEVDQDGDGRMSFQESADDWAVLGFDADFGERTGWFGLDPSTSSGQYNLTGYPGNAQIGGIPKMVNDRGAATDHPRYPVFEYESIDSANGTSGGPLWYQQDGEVFLAGVASTSAAATKVSSHYDEILDAIAGNDDALLTSGGPVGWESSGDPGPAQSLELLGVESVPLGDGATGAII